MVSAPAPHACTGDKQKLFRLIKSVQASQDGLSATPLTQRSNASQLQHTDLLDLGSSRDDFLSDFATGFDTQASPHTLLGHVSTMKPPTRAQTTPLSFADLVAQEQIDPNPPKIRVVVRKRPLNDKVCCCCFYTRMAAGRTTPTHRSTSARTKTSSRCL